MKRFLLVALAVLLFGPTTEPRSEAEQTDYAAICAAQVGVIPGFDCMDGVVVAITANGKTPERYYANMTCDRPALLPNGRGSDGQCVPYTRILDLSTDTSQISVMCRRKRIRPAESPLFDEIDVIAHNPVTGATCWFKAEGTVDRPLNGKGAPSPQSSAHGDFWLDPEAVVKDGCGNCHDNDPFMYSPYISQVWSHIPNDPFGPYFHVGGELGFDDWPTQSIAPRNSTCTGCHRIGVDATCGNLARLAVGRSISPGANESASRFPESHSMPPGHGLTHVAWEVIHAKSVDDILSCCSDSKKKFCNLANIYPRQPIP